MFFWLTLFSMFFSIIILDIRLYGLDNVVHRNHYLSFLTSLLMSPTFSPFAAIWKWIGLRISLNFSKSFSAWMYVMAIPLTAKLLMYFWWQSWYLSCPVLYRSWGREIYKHGTPWVGMGVPLQRKHWWWWCLLGVPVGYVTVKVTEWPVNSVDGDFKWFCRVGLE